MVLHNWSTFNFTMYLITVTRVLIQIFLVFFKKKGKNDIHLSKQDSVFFHNWKRLTQCSQNFFNISKLTRLTRYCLKLNTQNSNPLF